MYKIGFQNFRRFLDFQPIEYKGVTFLVGRNNAGKSTLVKALLLINDFLKSDDITTFSFGSNSLEDANIITYGRALNKVAANINYIKFHYEIDNYTIEITISGDTDKTKVSVVNFTFLDNENGFQFTINPPLIAFEKRPVEIGKANENSILINHLSIKEQELNNILNAIESKFSTEYININTELKSIQKKKDDLKKLFKNESLSRGGFLVETTFTKGRIMQILAEAIDNIDIEYRIQLKKSKRESFRLNEYKAFTNSVASISKSVEAFVNITQNNQVIYLGAFLTKQSALFAVRDKNNPLAQAIHDYQQLNIQDWHEAKKFVLKWIKAFEIGDSFEIPAMHAGEAYEVIIDDDGVKTHLADKGMGSIQAMLLIIRLASIIHKKQNNQLNYTVIIEEPELNLHPALQSKLTELFLETNQNYKLNFIIETHSEYILRNSQVLVAEREFEVGANENPFYVYYFQTRSDNELQPYRLEYQADGVFNRNFGNGFFDEASSRTLELLKLKRQKKA